MASAASSLADLPKLRQVLTKAKNIVVLTGAGISAESGIPTFRGSGGFWRTYQSQDLATPGAFKRSPSLVWEFYHYRREVVLSKRPNPAHIAIAEAETRLRDIGRKLTVITQNIDGLHQQAGSENVVELHGSLFKTQCLKCFDIAVNRDSPICPSLKGKGAPEPNAQSSEIPVDQLPKCKKDNCGGLLRPYIVWFGENLHDEDLCKAESALKDCEACLVVGTSSVVYPAAMYAPQLAERNIPVAEFNLEQTPASYHFMFHFQGPCTETLPPVLKDIWGATNVSETTSLIGTEIEDPPAVLSMKDKFKVFIKDYGATVIVFHISMSLVLLGGIYVAFSSGLDMSWLVNLLGLNETQGNIATGASTFVMAYAVNKVLAPLRFSITFACTPFIVRYLRSVGFLKTPK